MTCSIWLIHEAFFDVSASVAVLRALSHAEVFVQIQMSCLQYDANVPVIYYVIFIYCKVSFLSRHNGLRHL